MKKELAELTAPLATTSAQGVQYYSMGQMATLLSPQRAVSSKGWHTCLQMAFYNFKLFKNFTSK